MLEKLTQLEKKFEEINDKLSTNEVMCDMELYKKLMKEYKTLSPIVEKYREYKDAQAAIDDANEILSLGDSELKELAEEELRTGKEKLSSTFDELRILLLPKDPNDDKNVIVEIRGGAGGDEAALFAGTLYRMYTMYAEAAGFKSEIIYVNETELGGIKEISFMIEGNGAYSRFKFESGVHRVQRVPETEAAGRIHTSTVTVAVLPEADDVDISINMDDIEITRHRSAGAGGQHVNKTESAIRMLHKPTGIVVDCQDERSQIKNKARALEVLKARLYDAKVREEEERAGATRKSKIGTGDRAEKIRTYNYPQNRVTDHRIGFTTKQLDRVMNGDLDEIIEALITEDQKRKLAGEEDA